MSPSSCRDEHPLLGLNLKSLILFGVWPLREGGERARRLHHAVGLALYAFFLLFTLTQYVDLFEAWGDLEAMTTNASVTCLATTGGVKVWLLFGHRARFESLVARVSRLEQSVLAGRGAAVGRILGEYVARARRVTLFFWSLTAGTIAIFFVVPHLEYRLSAEYHRVFANGTVFWSRRRPMIFGSWFPFDKYAWPNYAFACAYQMTFGGLGAAYQAICDMFIVSMMIHSIGQLRILQQNLSESTNDRNKVQGKCKGKKCRRNKNDDDCRLPLPEIKHRRLVDCVIHHRYIIKYTNELNQILKPLMLLYFMECSLMLCAIGFQASLYGMSLRLCFMMEYLMAMMIQLFLYYWHGNMVVNENEKLLLASYDCKWYSECKRFKKSLLILREGLKIPIEFTVGPFYALSFPTFLVILRASYSYFTLLRQVQEKKK